MVKIQFYPLDVSYFTEEEGMVGSNIEKARIIIFGKTSEGKKIIVVNDYDPYFYIQVGKDFDVETLTGKAIEHKGKVHLIRRYEQTRKEYNGELVNVIKVVVNHPKAVPVFRDIFKEDEDIIDIFEADLNFSRKFLVDKKIIPLTLHEFEGDLINLKYKVDTYLCEEIIQVSDDVCPNLKVMGFDIETYLPESMEVSSVKNPIIMLAFFGVETDKEGNYEKEFRKIITWKKFATENKDIEFVNSEAELIEKFKEHIEKYDPDILTGYYSDVFDMTYIRDRADKYKINLNLGLDNTKIMSARGRINSQSIRGIVHIDIYQFVSKLMHDALDTDNFGLDSVAKELIGEGKDDISFQELTEAWDNHPEDLEPYCRYNLNDSRITCLLCIKLLPNIIELVKAVGLSPFEITRSAFSQLVEWFTIRNCDDFNQLIPNRPNHHEIKRRMMTTYKGGFVFEPKPGLYDGLAVFDFRSLYPSIIVSHNISPATFSKESAEGYIKVPETEYYFNKNKKGFLPNLIEDLIKRRLRVKEILKKNYDPALNARQQSLKTLANSFYGYLAFAGSRWYSYECADAITTYARYYINKVIDKAKEREFEVIYSDTDSIFIHIDTSKMDEAKHFIESINNDLPGIMELEFEGFYPKGIFVFTKSGTGGAKKKYALLEDSGKIKIRGFAYVRRDWSKIARSAQLKILEIILKEGDEKKAFNYIISVVNDIREGKVDNERLVVTTQLSKDIDSYSQNAPHVAVAQRMKNAGIKVGPGSLIRFVIVKGKDRISDRARFISEVKEGDYDPEYYINNQLVPAVEQIFNVLGYSKDDLLASKDQSKLDSFF
ncbi:DNA-directed DNA polymerase [Nanoarchaeota archaeon]